VLITDSCQNRGLRFETVCTFSNGFGQISVFVNYYNNDQYHEALNNVKPADVYYTRNLKILERRAQIKQVTMLLRKKTE
jgi:hypothetical protein